MTVREDAQQEHERQTAVVLELSLDSCENVFGVNDGVTSFCTAGIEDTGTAQAGTSTTITLASTASAVDDIYNGMTVRITGGTGSGQERRITDYVGSTKVATVAAWDTIPDATSTYDVIDRPNACYNTFHTCQDPQNFVKGSQTIKFCGRGMPIPHGELIRPYIKDVESAPTEIDYKAGLSRSHKASVTVVDDTDNDLVQDPYVDDRVTSAGGTFFSRLLARNPNYAMRFARLKRGFVVDPWDWNTFQTELYVIETIKGPMRGRTFRIVLKDPVKFADRAKIPAATDGALAAELLAGALSFDITGDATQYDTYGSPFWVQIGDETIKITSRVGQTFTVAERGAFNSPDEDHGAEDKVQLCNVYIDEPLTDVIIDLWNQAGVDSSLLDTVQMAEEELTWLGNKYHITRPIVEPTEVTEMISELCRLAAAGHWWDPVEQKFRFKVNMPDLVGTTPAVFDDEANLMLETVEVEPQDDDRITRAEIRYGLRTPASDQDETRNYQFGNIVIDNDAEGPNGFGDKRAEVIKTPWLGPANGIAASAFVSRMVAYFRDVQTKWKFHLDPKDYTIQLGELRDIRSDLHTDENGQPETVRLRITRLFDRGTHVEVGGISTLFSSRPAFIAETGAPDFADATDEQKQFAYICNAQGLMPDGTEGYTII